MCGTGKNEVSKISDLVAESVRRVVVEQLTQLRAEVLIAITCGAKRSVSFKVEGETPSGTRALLVSWSTEHGVVVVDAIGKAGLLTSNTTIEHLGECVTGLVNLTDFEC